MTGLPVDLSEMPEPDVVEQIRDGLRCLDLSGAIFLRAHWTAPWGYESPPHDAVVQMLQPGDRRVVLFHIFTEGSCQMRVGDAAPFDVVAGDVLIIPFADQHRLGNPDLGRCTPIGELMPPMPWTTFPVIQHGGGGAPAAMICGYLMSDDTPINPVLASLPPVMRIRPDGGPLAKWISASIEYALHAGQGRISDDPLLQRLPALLFTECLVEYAQREATGDRGWLAALADPAVGRALACMHREPKQPWTLQELSKRAATSRSVLDERFRTLLGQSPMAYLTAWRLQLASRQLRTTTATMAEIADAIGYTSEASFSRAFKRHVGVAPSVWRSTC